MGEFEGKSEINVRPEQNRSRPNGGRYLTYMLSLPNFYFILFYFILFYFFFLHAEGGWCLGGFGGR